MKRNKEKTCEQDKDISAARRGQRQRKPTAKCMDLMAATGASHDYAGKRRKVESDCVKKKEVKSVQDSNNSQSSSGKKLNRASISCHNKKLAALNITDLPIQPSLSSDLLVAQNPVLDETKLIVCENVESSSSKKQPISQDSSVTDKTEFGTNKPIFPDCQSSQSDISLLHGMAQREQAESSSLNDSDKHDVSTLLRLDDKNQVTNLKASSSDVAQENVPERQLDVSETFITIETKDGLSSEKIPFSQFLKKVIVDRESGSLKVDLSQLLSSCMFPSSEVNHASNKSEDWSSTSLSNSLLSSSQTDFESELKILKNEQSHIIEPGNDVTSEKPVKRRGRLPKHKHSPPSLIEIQGDSSISNDSSVAAESKCAGNNLRKISLASALSVKEKQGFSYSPRRSGRTPARNSRFGDDFVDSITLGKIASSSSTWNTQLMTLALAAETHKNKPSKSSSHEIDTDEKHEIFDSMDDDDDSEYSPDKSIRDISNEPGSTKMYEHSSKPEEHKKYASNIKNTLDEKKKRFGGNSIKGPKTLKKYEPVDPVVKRSLKDAFSHAMEATVDLLSTETVEVEEHDGNTAFYYTIMEPKMEASGNGLLVHKFEHGVNFKIVNFTGNLQSESQLSNLSKSYPQDRFFSCDLCENIFPSTNTWLQHNKYVHSRTMDSFETSLNKVSNIAEYKCEFCEQKFPHKFMLDIHIKRKRHSEVKTFRCTLCKESFATNKSREEHWIMSHPARSCGLCSKQFTNIVMLRRHINHNCHGARFRNRASISGTNPEVNTIICKQSVSSLDKSFTIDDDEEDDSENDDLEESVKETDVEEGSDDVEEDSPNSNLVTNESGKVECDHCGIEFSTYSGLWYHKLDEHHEYYPLGHREKLTEKLEKIEGIFQSAQDADLHKVVETNKNSFFVIMKPKWPPNNAKLSISVVEKDFVFKPSDRKMTTFDSLHQNNYNNIPLKKETSFYCMQCDESFQFASSYREHRSGVHGECFEVLRLLGAFQCTLCSETYPCRFMLDKHLKKHVGKKLLPCTLCGLFFHKIQERRLHWKTAHPGIGCPNCGKMYASIKYLQKHISLNCQDHFPPTKKFIEFQKKQLSDFDMPKNEKKVEKKIIQCHLCPKLCSSVHGWRRHMSEVHEDAGFSKLSNTCIICSELVFGYKALEKHLLENHAVESGLPVEQEDDMVEDALKKCDMDITLYRKAGCNNISIYQDEKGNYHCPSCPKTHTDLRALRTHIRIHVNMKLECSLCNKTFKNPTLLKQHVQRHRKDAVYSCDSCSKKFLTLQKLNKHRKVHHSTGNFVCDLCGMSFALNDYLQKHKRCHTDKRPHCCTICGKTFRTKPELRVHILIHTRETPYKCQFCSRGFSQKGNYRIHLAQHTGEKPYQCDQCEISFALLCHLKRHKITHDQKINYRCMWCDKECTQRKHMQMHVQRVHKEDFYQYEEQMKLEAPVPIAPSQVKLYNRRLGKMNKVRKQYRSRAQKCDSTIQQLMNGIVTKPEPMDDEAETSQNIVIEPIVESMMETGNCDLHVTAHESGGFEILVSDDSQNYSKHAIPVDLIGQDPSNVEIVMGENNEINIIIKDRSALQDVVGDQENLAQLSDGHIQVQESLQQVVEALVTHAKSVCDEDTHMSLGINELEKSALPFDSS